MEESEKTMNEIRQLEKEEIPKWMKKRHELEQIIRKVKHARQAQAEGT